MTRTFTFKQAIVFDVDGTLLCSADVDEQLYRASVKAVLGNVHFRARLADYQHVTDSGILADVFADNGIVAENALTAAIKDEFVARMENYVVDNGPFREFPGARDYLHKVIESPEHVCAIATGGWRQTALIKLRTAGFDVDRIPLATSDESIARAAIMQNALDALGTELALVTYFGDGPWDRDACEELGWRFRAVGPVLSGLAHFADDNML